MPLYEYECGACGHRFERIQRFSDEPVRQCPSCGRGPVNKLLSAPAIQFKGTGWYVTDYAGKKGDAGTTPAPSTGASAPASGDTPGAGSSAGAASPASGASAGPPAAKADT